MFKMSRPNISTYSELKIILLSEVFHFNYIYYAYCYNSKIIIYNYPMKMYTRNYIIC